MNLFEFIPDSEDLIEAKLVWAKKGKNKVVRKFRCTFGRRKGRLVAKQSQCSAPLDLKKRYVLKRTKAAKGARMMRKARKTKKYNPASKRVAAMNKAMRR
tara:strand:+ start:137 stop:436 length:300 start_codon:yes stop_codon:yes gene_type:complete